MSHLQDSIDALDLEEWLQDYVDVIDAGGYELRIKECPECHESKWKVYVNTEKKLWHCKHCDWGRGSKDVVHLLSAVSGRNKTDIRLELLKGNVPAPKGDIIQMLEGKFGMTDEYVGVVEVEPIVLPGHSLAPAGDLGYVGRSVLSYATSRGLSYDRIEAYKLHYSQSLWMRKRNGDMSKITGPFLIFPVMHKGLVVGFQGRRISEGCPKYVSVDNLKNFLWPMGGELFKVFARGDTIYLVEGVFDALGALMMGYPALCTFGKSISDSQIQYLKSFNPGRVVLAWDEDAAKEIRNTAARLRPHFPITEVALFKSELDAGDALLLPKAQENIQQVFENTLDVRSPEYLRWCIDEATKSTKKLRQEAN